MSITRRIIAGLASGPATLSDLLPDAKKGDRTANAATLERLGVIRRIGMAEVARQPVVRHAVLWERVPAHEQRARRNG